MSGHVIYDWCAARRLWDWKLEGRGELGVTEDGSLWIRTYDCGPGRRATNVWLKGVTLPEAFEMEWTFASEAAAGNTMVIFNAVPLGLSEVFEDPRPDALYCDLASYGKLVCHTIGFHRAVYGRPSVLRKLGGQVPAEWGQAVYPTAAWQEMNEVTTLHSTSEPLAPGERGKPHRFRLAREGRDIRFWVNGQLIHDVTDEGQYPYHTEPLVSGHMAFRNFSGFADDVYSSIVIRRL